LYYETAEKSQPGVEALDHLSSAQFALDGLPKGAKSR
jgi:hypothetical protein